MKTCFGGCGTTVDRSLMDILIYLLDKNVNMSYGVGIFIYSHNLVDFKDRVVINRTSKVKRSNTT